MLLRLQPMMKFRFLELTVTAFMFSLLRVSRSQQIATIQKCEFFNAAEIKCSWMKTSEKQHLNLFYNRLSAPKCTEKCLNYQETNASDGSALESCTFSYPFLHETFYFFFAESCGPLPNSECYNCTNRTGEMTEFNTTAENVIMTLPPIDFEFRDDELLAWGPPYHNDSMLPYAQTETKRELVYKLVYERTGCIDKQFDQDWQVWYIGNEAHFRPKDLIPGCTYITKVSAALMKNEDESPDDVRWSEPSKNLQFSAPAVPGHKPNAAPSTEGGTTAEVDSQDVSSGAVSKAIIPTLFAVSLLFIFVIFVLFRKKLDQILPTKTKIPKPILMISLKDFDKELMPFNDDEESEKAAFFGQALFQFKKDEVLSRKEQSSANANNNGTTFCRSPPSGVIISDYGDDHHHLHDEGLAASEIFPLVDNCPNSTNGSCATTDIRTVNQSDSCDVRKNSFCGLTLEKPQDHPTALVYSVCDFETSSTSDEVFGFPSEEKVEEAGGSRRSFSDFNFMARRSSFGSDCFEYVADASGNPCTSGTGSVFRNNDDSEANNLSTQLHSTPQYLFHTECCHSTVGSSLSTFSSLPSVTSDYLVEYSLIPDLLNKIPLYKVVTSSTCGHCQKRLLLKHGFEDPKRNSFCGVPCLYDAARFAAPRSRPIDTTSLDSGCGPELALSP